MFANDQSETSRFLSTFFGVRVDSQWDDQPKNVTEAKITVIEDQPKSDQVVEDQPKSDTKNQPKNVIEDHQSYISDENVCIVTDSDEHAQPTSYIYFDTTGKAHTMVDNHTSQIICSNTPGPIVHIASGKWIPFFDETCVSDENKTFLQDGILTINVVKFGMEDPLLRPFGNHLVNIQLPIVVECTWEDKDLSGQITGISSKTIHGVTTIDLPELIGIPAVAPYIVKATIKLEK